MNIGYIRNINGDPKKEKIARLMRESGIDERRVFIDTGLPERYVMWRDKGGIREGDVLYIDSLGSLGNSYAEIIFEWNYITNNLQTDIVLFGYEEVIDTRKFKAMGDAGKYIGDQFLYLLAFMAAKEKELHGY